MILQILQQLNDEVDVGIGFSPGIGRGGWFVSMQKNAHSAPAFPQVDNRDGGGIVRPGLRIQGAAAACKSVPR